MEFNTAAKSGWPERAAAELGVRSCGHAVPPASINKAATSNRRPSASLSSAFSPDICASILRNLRGNCIPHATFHTREHLCFYNLRVRGCVKTLRATRAGSIGGHSSLEPPPMNLTFGHACYTGLSGGSVIVSISLPSHTFRGGHGLRATA